MERTVDLSSSTSRPECFYRYTTVERAEEILTECKIFYPSAVDFNDPFDCKFRPVSRTSKRDRKRFNRELIRERNPRMPRPLVNRLATQASGRAAFQKGAMRLRDRIVRSVGMLCLTEREESVLMWSHYSDKHRGICLQFRGLETLETPPLQVVYSDDYPEVDILEYEPFINGTDSTARAKQMEMVRRMYLTKAKDWAYEYEWRIVDWAAARRGSRGLHPFDPRMLTGVILGCQIPASDRKKIEGWIAGSKATPVLYNAVQSPESFRLEIEPAN
ncbi:MAG: DUF2971 domain-containing protein [Candidatus Binataceae bacterium]